MLIRNQDIALSWTYRYYGGEPLAEIEVAQYQCRSYCSSMTTSI